MNKKEIVKGSFRLAFVAITILVLSGFTSVNPHQNEQPVRTVSPEEVAPLSVVVIDKVPYPAGEIEKLVSSWDNASGEMLSDFQKRFNAISEGYMNYLSGLTVMPTQDNPEVLAFLDKLSVSVNGFYTDTLTLRSLIMARLDTYAIDRETPYELTATKQFDDLFRSIQVISINGYQYPASVVNTLWESMREISEVQWSLLSNHLEATLTTMYTGRKKNSRYFAQWVNNNLNHLVTKPFKELFGAWEKEYAEQYNTRINHGIDTELSVRQITEIKDRGDIILKGYFDILACTKIPDNFESAPAASIVQKINYKEFFVPYTLPQNVFTAGELMAIDTSQWKKETNNRLAGAVGAGFRIVDVAGLVFSILPRFHPIGAGVAIGIEGIQWVYHFFTKGKKIDKLGEEINAALDEELDLVLTVLRNIPEGKEKAAVITKQQTIPGNDDI